MSKRTAKAKKAIKAAAKTRRQAAHRAYNYAKSRQILFRSYADVFGREEKLEPWFEDNSEQIIANIRAEKEREKEIKFRTFKL